MNRLTSLILDQTRSRRSRSHAGLHPEDTTWIGNVKRTDFSVCEFSAALVGSLIGILNPWAGVCVGAFLSVNCQASGEVSVQAIGTPRKQAGS